MFQPGIRHYRIDPGGFGWIITQSTEGLPESGHTPVKLGGIEFPAEHCQDAIQLLVSDHRSFTPLPVPEFCKKEAELLPTLVRVTLYRARADSYGLRGCGFGQTR